MKKRWVVNESDMDQLARLQTVLDIHPVLLKLLVQRGICTFDDAKKFFRPQLTDIHDPFLMRDMDKAIDRIDNAITNHEKILIYGDYDVDGTTAISMVYCFFREFGLPVEYYVPNRYTEGYGISTRGIDWANENGFKLIIALDCGIKSIDKVDYANSLSIDFIICDHHLPGERIPQAVAVLDPKRKDCDYPYKELSGCGIGFKLIAAFAQRHNLPLESYSKYLDFLVVSIASDIVPITGENRVLAHYGLQKINQQPSEGLRALIQMNSVKKEFTISDLVFVIGPRINAAGRMDDARNAVRLLISESAHAAGNAVILNKHNIDRREYDSSITSEALNMLQNDPSQAVKKSTVLFQPHWHKGVIGIVASRLIETWYRPTIILTESNGFATGSARSVAGFNIYEAILACRDLLEQFGGHMFAAGLTMQVNNVDAFIERFEEVVASTIEERYLTPEIEINAELKIEDITPKFYNVLKQLAPFGPHNMKPVFITRQLNDTGWSRVVGSEHLKFSVKKDNSPSLGGVGFGMAPYLDIIKSGKPFDLCYTLEENEWNGKKRIEMNVKDVKVL